MSSEHHAGASPATLRAQDDAPLPAGDLPDVIAALPGVWLLLAADPPRFTMIAASEDRLAATMTTRQATMGRPLFEVFPDANPDNPQRSGVGNLRASLETVLRTKQTHRMAVQRYDIRRADGAWEERYWTPVNVPVLGPDREVRFLVHHVEDVTEALLRRQALDRAELRAARILDRMADAHTVLDREFRFVAVNPAAERMVGRRKEEMLGRTQWEVFPASATMEIGAAYRRVVADGVEQHLQQHYVGEGHDIHLDVDAYPTDEGGIAIFMRDVSEAVRAAEARRKSMAQRYLAHLADALRSVNDPARMEAEATRLLAEQLGASRGAYAEAHGDDDTCVVRHEHLREPLPSLARAHAVNAYDAGTAGRLREGQTVAVPDVRGVSQLSTTERVAYEAAAVRAFVVVPMLRDGRVVACLSVQQTVPRTWTNDEIMLVEQTAERTWAAVERARAEAALQEASRRKDEFLATLAHELRNPLAPVRNGLQILRLSPPGAPATVHALNMMDRQVSHMVRLIDDLLDVSRISQGKLELRRDWISLRSVLDAAVEASRPFIDAAGHALTLDLPEAGLRLYADGTRLAQVIGNLLTNSAKYTPDGGQITLSGVQEGREVVIRVADTGVGIPPEMLSHVFDLFTQVGDSSGRAQGGLGIGLSIGRRLVQMHGGSIEAHSKGAGLGAVFTVRLPLAPVRPEMPQRPPASTPQRAARAGQRVLVVDDNRDAADSLGMMLELFGCTIRRAYGGQEALAAAREFRPSVVFCDIGMPGMNGYEVARELRADPALARPHLVALTGWGTAEDKRRAREAGFDFHLAKPVEAAAVQEVLARFG